MANYPSSPTTCDLDDTRTTLQGHMPTYRLIAKPASVLAALAGSQDNGRKNFKFCKVLAFKAEEPKIISVTLVTSGISQRGSRTPPTAYHRVTLEHKGGEKVAKFGPN
ncbi:hypothetical protein J6590_024004 [Homalodisca vitripennis]|nr:hypothetical protein J6590_024004 [Homalodisca vitripennis]